MAQADVVVEHREAVAAVGSCSVSRATGGKGMLPATCCPSPVAPVSAWSLWDMLCNLKVFVTALEALGARRESLHARSPDDALPRDDEIGLATTFYNWQLLSKQFDLPTCLATTVKLIGRWDESRTGASKFIAPLTVREAIGRISEFDENFRYDTQARRMFLMGRDKSALFNTGFGPLVDSLFSADSVELSEANNCCAVERYTASVFHCMRGVEHGLRSLAVAVGAPAQKLPFEYEEWNKLIDMVDCYWKSPVAQWGKSKEQVNARQFFKRIVADLHAFKDDVRNLVMHTRGDYDELSARSVLNRTREWFLLLAEKTNENMGHGQLVMDRTLFS
ncbi:MAG: hypothetical protein LC804_08820 [Acidobacteria bacterium]|nr:hypothetical protein [Acidobacteriota bacterium]